MCVRVIVMPKTSRYMPLDLFLIHFLFNVVRAVIYQRFWWTLLVWHATTTRRGLFNSPLFVICVVRLFAVFGTSAAIIFLVIFGHLLTGCWHESAQFRMRHVWLCDKGCIQGIWWGRNLNLLHKYLKLKETVELFPAFVFITMTNFILFGAFSIGAWLEIFFFNFG